MVVVPLVGLRLLRRSLRGRLRSARWRLAAGRGGGLRWLRWLLRRLVDAHVGHLIRDAVGASRLRPSLAAAAHGGLQLGRVRVVHGRVLLRLVRKVLLRPEHLVLLEPLELRQLRDATRREERAGWGAVA